MSAAFDAGINYFAGRFDGLIRCAGIYLQSSSEQLDLTTWTRVLDVNLGGSLIASALAGRHLIDAGRSGSVVLVSSIAAYLGDRTEPGAGYAASKGGVVALARQLAVEWGGHGIRTNAVVPGVIDTAMTTIVNDPVTFGELLSGIPLGRIGTPDEVAEACLFLSSSRAGFVNGIDIPVDGGQLVN